jgi:hypothetical protein
MVLYIPRPGNPINRKACAAHPLFPAGDSQIRNECPAGNKTDLPVFPSMDINALTGNTQNHAVRSIIPVFLYFQFSAKKACKPVFEKFTRFFSPNAGRVMRLQKTRKVIYNILIYQV